MGNFYSFLKKKIINESINTNNNSNNSPFLKNNDAKIDIYLEEDEDDNKDLPAYSQATHLCLII